MKTAALVFLLAGCDLVDLPTGSSCVYMEQCSSGLCLGASGDGDDGVCRDRCLKVGDDCTGGLSCRDLYEPIGLACMPT